MNKAILIGRLTKDAETRYTQGDNSMAVTRYTLACDRKFKKDSNEDTADFIPCVAFGKAGEFAQKYFRKGTKVAVTGRIQTGSYTNKNGEKVYTTEIVIEEQEFAESKNANNANSTPTAPQGFGNAQQESFMNIPDGISEELPFN